MTSKDSNALEQVLTVNEVQAILVISSRLLTYPPVDLTELVREIKVCIAEEIKLDVVRKELEVACSPLFNLSSKEWKELYVSTFDLKSKMGLYLTAHEFGDSPKRGAALIKLQKVINQAGYEREDGELADFIPMLFEFIVVAPERVKSIRLYNRLAIVLNRIFTNMDQNNPYTRIFGILITHVFPQPTKKEMEEVEHNREEADLEELPFPIMYQ